MGRIRSMRPSTEALWPHLEPITFLIKLFLQQDTVECQMLDKEVMVDTTWTL